MDVTHDTCALLSLARVADKSLSEKALHAIEKTACVYVLDYSCFEHCHKNKRGILTQCVYHYGLTEIPVSSADFTAAALLPEHNAAPFDRIIIAKASRLSRPLPC